MRFKMSTDKPSRFRTSSLQEGVVIGMRRKRKALGGTVQCASSRQFDAMQSSEIGPLRAAVNLPLSLHD